MKGRHFIETSDWEEKFLKQERRIDALCWVIVVTSILYFIPVCSRAISG